MSFKRKMPSNRELASMLTEPGGHLTTRVIDRGYSHFVDELDFIERNKPYVAVGVHKDAGMHQGEDGQSTTVAQVAKWNEFGTSRIPERSFIRSTFDERNRAYSALVEKLILLVYLRQETVLGTLAILGQMIETDIKNKIVTLRDPPNAPGTIKKKKSSNPLIDTGQMKNSIRYVVYRKDRKGGLI